MVMPIGGAAAGIVFKYYGKAEPFRTSLRHSRKANFSRMLYHLANFIDDQVFVAIAAANHFDFPAFVYDHRSWERATVV